MNKKNIELSVLDVLNFTNEIKEMPNFSYDAYNEQYKKSHFKILFNFIKSFSKSDYDYYNTHVDSSFLNKIYNNILSRNNSLILSSFLEIGVFVEKLSPNSKWLFEFLHKNSSFEDKSYIYDSIVSLQIDYEKEKIKSEKINHNSLFYEVFKKFLIENRLNFDLISKYLDEFYLQNKTIIVNYLFDISKEKNHDKIINLILEKYKDENIQKDFNLNKFLPVTNINNLKDKFFIYDGERKKIKKLTEIGFSINDHSYLFNNTTLFLILVEIKKVINNYSFSDYSYLLDHVKNFNGAMPEDIELFSKEKEYKFLKARYEYYFISSEVVNKNNIKDYKIKV